MSFVQALPLEYIEVPKVLGDSADVEVLELTKCQLCQRIPLSPYVEQVCGHTFCRVCLDVHERSIHRDICPTCQAQHMIRRDAAVAKKHASLKTHCPNQPNGVPCEWFGTWLELWEHMLLCPSRKILSLPAPLEASACAEKPFEHSFVVNKTVRVGSQESDFATITEALDAAEDGWKIIVAPGKYYGPFEIKKNVWIAGEDVPKDVILILTPADALALEKGQTSPLLKVQRPATNVVVSSLSLNCFVPTSQIVLGSASVDFVLQDCIVKGAEDVTATDMVAPLNSSVVIERDGSENLDETGNLACVRLLGNLFIKAPINVGKGAVVVVDNNTIKNASGNGIFISGDSSVLVINNEISECSMGIRLKDRMCNVLIEKNGFIKSIEAHITVQGSETVTIRNNSFENSSGHGVIFTDDCLATFEQNELRNSFKSQILIQRKANPIIQHCILMDGNVGISCTEGGRGYINDVSCIRHVMCHAHLLNEADPYITRSKFTESSGIGVICGPRACGLIVDSTFSKNSDPQIELQGNCYTSFRNCKIFDGIGRGIYAHDYAGGTIEGCEIYDHPSASVGAVGFPQIDVDNFSITHFLQNSIRGGAGNGFLIHRSARPLVQENDLKEHKLAQIEVSHLAEPHLVSNTVHNAATTGLYVHSRGKGLYEGNNIFRHTDEGLPQVFIEKQSAIHMIDNFFCGGAGVGIIMQDENTKVILERNRIEDNVGTQIVIANGADVTLVSNDIIKGQSIGAYISDKSTSPKIFGNKFGGNQDTQILVSNGADPWIEKNEVSDGHGKGIVFNGQSVGKLLSNKIFGNFDTQLVIIEKAAPLIKDNGIFKGGNVGVMISDSSKPTVDGNTISENGSIQIDVTSLADPLIKNNKVSNGVDVGIRFTDNAGGVLENNEIFNHKKAQVQIAFEAHPIISKNTVRDGSSHAFIIHDMGCAILTENDIFSHKRAQIAVISKAVPTIKRCKIHDGAENAILISGAGSSAIVERNDIYAHHSSKYAQIALEKGASATIVKNNIHHGEGPGVMIALDSKGLVEGNQIHHHEGTQLEIQSNSDPIVSNNKIYHGSSFGIWVHSDGCGLIENNKLFGNNGNQEQLLVDSAGQPIVRGNSIVDPRMATSSPTRGSPVKRTPRKSPRTSSTQPTPRSDGVDSSRLGRSPRWCNPVQLAQS